MRHIPSGGQWLFVLLLTLGGVVPAHAQTPNDANFLSTLGELREASYDDKAAIIERLSKTGHPSIRAVLTALLEDRLYYRNSDQKIFIAKAADADPVNLIDPISLKDAGTAAASDLTQIGTNNGLRRTLRTTVAHFALSSPDAAVRLDAVREMVKSLDEPTVTLLRERIGVETNSSVKKEIATGLALAALDGSDSNARLEAVATLSAKRQPDVRNKTGSRFCSRSLPMAASPKVTSGYGAPRPARWHPSTVGALSIPASRHCFLA